MSSTPQVMKKCKTTDDELGLDETTKSSPTTKATTPRRMLSAVSSWLNRSTSPSSSSKLKNNSNVQQHQRPTPTAKNAPAKLLLMDLPLHLHATFLRSFL